MKKGIIFALLIAGGLIALTSGLDARGRGNFRNGPCAEDFKQYCGDVMKKRDRGAMKKCIDENYGNFSDACKKKIDARKERRSGQRSG